MLITPHAERVRTVEDLIGPSLAARLDRLDLLSRRVFAGRLPGERRSKRRGRSVEFDDYRDYTPGDDLRHLDWNVYARLDKFLIKLFREEEDLGLHVVIDGSASMEAGATEASPSKLLFAHRLAMGLGYLGLVNQNRVSVAVFGAAGGARLRRLAPMRGRRNVQRLAAFLVESMSERPAGAAAEPDFAGAMREFALSRRGKGVVVLVSDFLFRAGLAEGLNYLVGGHDVDAYAIHVLSPGELEPERDAERGLVGDLRLTDSESGSTAEVTLSGALIRAYKRRLEDHVAAVRAACRARSAAHEIVRSDTDPGDLLLGSLRRRGLLG